MWSVCNNVLSKLRSSSFSLLLESITFPKVNCKYCDEQVVKKTMNGKNSPTVAKKMEDNDDREDVVQC